jgi:uncharacterized protein YutE (UPF0331/DUF86 family)
LVDRDALDRRLAKLEACVRELRRLAGTDRETFLRDVALQAQAERLLHLAAEACIDIAHHLIADRGWRTPGTYREAFEVLAAEGVLTPELSARMASWAGLRDVLVHLYLEVDHRMIHDAMTRDLHELDAFAAAIARAMDEGG